MSRSLVRLDFNKVYCGICNTKLTSLVDDDDIYYLCESPHDKRRIRHDVVESTLISKLVEAKNSPWGKYRLLDAHSKQLALRQGILCKEKHSQQEKDERLEEKRSKLWDAALNSTIDIETYQSGIAILKEESKRNREDVWRWVRAIGVIIDESKSAKEGAEKLLGQVEHWRDLSRAERQSWLETYVNRIDLVNDSMKVKLHIHRSAMKPLFIDMVVDIAAEA